MLPGERAQSSALLSLDWEGDQARLRPLCTFLISCPRCPGHAAGSSQAGGHRSQNIHAGSTLGGHELRFLIKLLGKLRPSEGL